MRRGFALMLLLVLGVMAGASQASIVLGVYDNKAAFDAATDPSSMTAIDFEGIVGELDYVLDSSFALSGVTFSTTAGTMLGISGKDAGAVPGTPFNSALLFATGGATPLIATLPSGTTAVGGFFGDIDSAGSITDMRIKFASGFSIVASLTTSDMGKDTASNFFGWTIAGDTIVSITHGFRDEYAGIDDFQYGHVHAPEPASCIVWSLIGVCFAGAGWWRRGRAA